MTGPTRIEDLVDQTYDPRMADDAMFGTIEDPYSILAELRATAPVVEASLAELIGMPSPPFPGYGKEFVVLSHAGVEQVLMDPITFSNRLLAVGLANYGPLLPGMDPPEHTQHRRILQRAFRSPSVQQWTDDAINPVVDEVLATVRGAGRAELVEQVCRPIPFDIVLRLLDLPPADVDIFYRLTMAQIITVNADEASEKLRRYFTSMINERRAAPGTDLVSVMATTEADGEFLREDVIIAFLLTLMSAAGETTFRTLTVLLTGLLTAPDQLEAVRKDRDLVPQAVEEALRWDGPVTSGPRVTTCDTVIDGIPVPANSIVNVAYGAANRDPAVFKDPDRFDIFRDQHRHFAFAFGAHNCLGQLLARVELAAALNGILDQMPNLRLDPAEPTPRCRGAVMRTPRQLHVLYD